MIRVERIDASGCTVPIEPQRMQDALLEGQSLHCAFRPAIVDDYPAHMQRMAEDGAAVMQLVDEGEVRAIALWRTYLTTYCGRRFEIDDLVTQDGQRSQGYGATLIEALESKARSLACDVVTLSSATWRTDAHRFYHRQRYTISSFLFFKELR